MPPDLENAQYVPNEQRRGSQRDFELLQLVSGNVELDVHEILRVVDELGDTKESVSLVWAIREAERGDWERRLPGQSRRAPRTCCRCARSRFQEDPPPPASRNLLGGCTPRRRTSRCLFL